VSTDAFYSTARSASSMIDTPNGGSDLDNLQPISELDLIRLNSVGCRPGSPSFRGSITKINSSKHEERANSESVSSRRPE